MSDEHHTEQPCRTGLAISWMTADGVWTDPRPVPDLVPRLSEEVDVKTYWKRIRKTHVEMFSIPQNSASVLAEASYFGLPLRKVVDETK